MKKLRCLNPQKGQSFVELGVFLVILLVILSGVLEFGMLMYQYIAMKDAAQEGAVYASMFPSACNQTIERIKQGVNNIDPAKLEVEIQVNGVACASASAADACASHEVKVMVRQPNYEIMVPFLGTILGRQTISVSADTSSTIIRPPCP